MVLDEADEIAPAESMLRQIAGESNFGIKAEGHSAKASMGIKVMNFVVPDKVSLVVRLPCEFKQKAR